MSAVGGRILLAAGAADLREGAKEPTRRRRYQLRLNELLGCSPRVVVALGQLQPKWQQL